MKTKTTRTSYINARIEPRLKVQAQKVLKTVGLSTSDFMTLTMKQVVLQRGIPFSVNIPNAKSRAAMRELNRGRGKRFTGSTKDFFKILDAETK